MKNLVLALALFACLCGPARAGTTTTAPTAPAPTPSMEACRPRVAQLEKQMLELPYDGDRQYLTVVGLDGEARYEALKGAFARDVNLQNLRGDVHFTALSKGSVMFDARYANDFQTLPTVRLTNSDGAICYEATGDKIPPVDQLYSDLAEAHGSWRSACFHKPQPKPSPPPVVIQPQPRTPAPPFVEEPKMIPMWLYAVIAVVGFGLGMAKFIYGEWT